MELEADPLGLSFLDIEQLLDEWGVTRTLPGQDAMGYRLREHPDLPGFIFYYPLRDELAPATVRQLCRAVRELENRLRKT